MADIVIIGGGVTGLSAGIHLLKDGGGLDRVTVVEGHKVAGGNLTGWDRGGCHIDNCIHWLTGTGPESPAFTMWHELGVLGEDGLRRLPSLFTVRDGGQSLTLWRDLDKTWRELLAVSFEDRAEINRLCHAVRLVMLYGHMGGIHADPVEILRYSPRLLQYWSISTGQLAGRMKHPLLKQFVTAVCGNAFSALCLVTVMATFCSGNGDLPVGGSRQAAANMARRFCELGGVLWTGCRAVGVPLVGVAPFRQAQGVLLSDGRLLRADRVIYTGDPYTFCGSVLDAPLPHDLQKQHDDPKSVRFSGLHAAFACPTEALTFSGDLICPLAPGDRPAFGGDKLILREFSHEPSFAPTGETVLEATVFCGERASRSWIKLARDRAGYAARKAAVGEAFRRLAEAVCPDAAGRLTLLDVWTPATYRRFTGSETGSFMSFILRPGMLPRTQDGHIPGVDNVLLAGQWLRAPGGLPIAAAEGKRAAETVLKSLRRKTALPTRARPGHITADPGVLLQHKS